MPYKFETDKIHLPKDKDRRRSITDQDRAMMKELRAGGMSYNKIAAAIGCSKRAVMFVINPETEAKCKEQYKERRKDGRYYIKSKSTRHIREHRNYKQKILKEIKQSCENSYLNITLSG